MAVTLPTKPSSKAGTLTLVSLKLRNFKGVRDFTLDLNGRDVQVFGDNGTGKTTIADAFTWLLFDKSSDNRKDFEIKTIGEDGKAISNLEHEVEAVLMLDEKRIELKKVFVEKWTKSRGSSTAVFDGHTTNYFVNEVPVQQAQFKATVSAICDESVFRLLTDPTFFNSTAFTWQKRRALLLDVCGDVSDADVIASKSSLEPLNEALDDRTLDEYRAILSSKRKKINAELENVPVRIDEARRQLPEISETREAIQVRIDELTLDRIAKREEYSRIESGSQVAEIKKQIAEIDAEILALKYQETQALLEVDRERRSKIGEVESRADDAKRAITRIELEIKDAEHRLENLKKRHAEASAKHKQIREQSFSPKPFAESCAACGQSLPSEQIESARKHALEEWNLEQSKKLEQIVSDGRQVRVEIDSTQQHVDALKAKLEEARTISAQASDALVEAKATLTHCIEVAADPRIKELEDRKQSKKIDLENLSLCDHDAKEQIKAQISNLDALIAEQQQKIAKHEQEAKLKTRIEELLAEEKKLVQEIEKIDHQLFLSDEFIRTKVSMLEHRINSKFELVGFKLFDQQVNGAIAETCICTVNGVPYDGALNHGSRINAGLDVIRTLQSHYGFFPPVIIDGAESTTRFLSMPCQLVKLYVSEQDKALRIETSQP